MRKAVQKVVNYRNRTKIVEIDFFVDRLVLKMSISKNFDLFVSFLRFSRQRATDARIGISSTYSFCG